MIAASSTRGRSSLQWRTPTCGRGAVARPTVGYPRYHGRSSVLYFSVCVSYMISERAVHKARVPFPTHLDTRLPSPGGTVIRRGCPGLDYVGGARRTWTSCPEVSAGGLLPLGAPAASAASEASRRAWVGQRATGRTGRWLTPGAVTRGYGTTPGGLARARCIRGP